MPNPLKGEAAFEHDFGSGGETLTLRLNASALLEAEEASGVGLLGMIESGFDNLKVVGELLRAGLRHGCGRELTRVEAVDLVLECPAAGQALLKALGVALPDADREAGAAGSDPRAAAGAGTGIRSSSTGAKPGSRRKNSGKPRRG